MYSRTGHPRCRWVCFFIGTDLEIFIITSLAHQWIICSEWVPSVWKSKQLIKISEIYNNPHNSNFTVRQNLHVCNKCIIVLYSIHRSQLKCKSSIHNISFSSENVVSSESEKYALRKHHLQMKTVQNCFLQTCSFSSHKTLTDGPEWRGLLVDYCDVFYQLF